MAHLPRCLIQFTFDFQQILFGRPNFFKAFKWQVNKNQITMDVMTFFFDLLDLFILIPRLLDIQGHLLRLGIWTPKTYRSNTKPKEVFGCLQGGPPTSYKYGYKSTYRGYNPSYPIIRPFIGVITPFITSRGPPCRECLFIPFVFFSATQYLSTRVPR